MVAPRGRVWLLRGGMRSCSGGACMVALRGMRGCSVGACVVAPGGACVVTLGRACVVFSRGGMRRIRQDTVYEQAVRILLECILVLYCIYNIILQ